MHWPDKRILDKKEKQTASYVEFYISETQLHHTKVTKTIDSIERMLKLIVMSQFIDGNNITE